MGWGTHQEYFLGTGLPEALQQKVTFWPASRTRDSGCFTRYGFSEGKGSKDQGTAPSQLLPMILPKSRALPLLSKDTLSSQLKFTPHLL